MNVILLNLLQLQTLEFGETPAKKIESQVAELRNQIPLPILGHYDRLRVRGKKGLAAVRNQVCTGCHMHVPIGQINVLMRGEDIQLCESCGRYLYLPDPVPAEAVAAAEPAKPTAKKAPAKPRKRRALAAAA
jgi:hypothetical protein